MPLIPTLQNHGATGAIFARPRISAWRRPFASAVASRISPAVPRTWLGTVLACGGLLAAFGGGCYAGWATNLFTLKSLVAVDHRLSLWFEHQSAPALAGLASLITFAGSPLLLTVGGLIALYLLLRRRAWYDATALVVAVGGGSLLNLALKHLFQRTRPHFDPPLIAASDYSFPSGHTLGATLFYGFLATLLVTAARRRHTGTAAPWIAGGIVGLIGLSRLYLGAHYLSDVLVGVAVGLGWLAICLAVAAAVRSRWMASGPAPMAAVFTPSPPVDSPCILPR